MWSSSVLLLIVAAQGALLRPVMLYVDPCEERMHVVPSLERRGVEYVLLHSSPAAAAIIEAAQEAGDDGAAERVRDNAVPEPGEELVWATAAIPDDATICGVLCSSDGGLADAERLQDVLVPARSNGVNVARRDKFLMLEAVREAGLAAPMQACPRSLKETLQFLCTQQYPVVLKPRRGQASVLVGLAHNENDARRMDAVLRDPSCHASIDTSELGAGDTNVLVQEFLGGEEYVVDTVSADGEHRVLALWRYDKREANGAPFVYFGIDALPGAGEVQDALVAYAREVLDAFGWRWGPCHLEVKLVPNADSSARATASADGAAGSEPPKHTSPGPVPSFAPMLIEINAGRWNGEEFKDLSSLCTGYDALEATLDAYLDPQRWSQVPRVPCSPLLAHGKNVKLVSRTRGALAAPPAEAHAESLAAMQSLLCFEPVYSVAGEPVFPTCDLASCAGYAHLVHRDAALIERDYQALHALPLFAVRAASSEDNVNVARDS